MYAYLINKEGYDHESLKAYKSWPCVKIDEEQELDDLYRHKKIIWTFTLKQEASLSYTVLHMQTQSDQQLQQG